MKKSLYSSGRTGNPVNRDSINTKVFEEERVGFGEGEEKLSEERLLPPPSNLPSPSPKTFVCGRRFRLCSQERADRRPFLWLDDSKSIYIFTKWTGFFCNMQPVTCKKRINRASCGKAPLGSSSQKKLRTGIR